MLVAQLLPFAKNLCTRKWTDEDIIEDVQFLRDELKARFESLTYVSHTSSWIPVSKILMNWGSGHMTSTLQNSLQDISLGPLFTNLNYSGKRMSPNWTTKITNNSSKNRFPLAFPCFDSRSLTKNYIRILIRLLNESTDPTVLAVAAHDLGQYVKHYERGKK